MPTPPYQGMRYYKCCMDCPRRTPACSDRCADYQIAKAFKAAEKAQEDQRKLLYGRHRTTNGRK